MHKVTVAPIRVKKISSLDNNLFSFHDIRDTIKQFPTRSLKYYTFIQLILWKKLSQPKSAKLVFHFTCRTNLHVDRPINLKVSQVWSKNSTRVCCAQSVRPQLNYNNYWSALNGTLSRKTVGWDILSTSTSFP